MRKKIAKMLALAVAVAGIMVMFGWIFDIGVLKSISSSWVSMKFDTAIVFVASGLSLYFIVRAREGEFDKAQVVISITSMIIILLMGILFFSAVFGIRTGVEDLFVKETNLSARTVTPGRPSLPTVMNFLLIALAGIFTLFDPLKTRFKLQVIGSLVGLIGLLAVAGYIINVPYLYYYLPGVNSAMACHTAILFVLTGIGLLCL
jgi:hypothetical protein